MFKGPFEQTLLFFFFILFFFQKIKKKKWITISPPVYTCIHKFKNINSELGEKYIDDKQEVESVSWSLLHLSPQAEAFWFFSMQLNWRKLRPCAFLWKKLQCEYHTWLLLSSTKNVTQNRIQKLLFHMQQKPKAKVKYLFFLFWWLFKLKRNLFFFFLNSSKQWHPSPLTTLIIMSNNSTHLLAVMRHTCNKSDSCVMAFKS